MSGGQRRWARLAAWGLAVVIASSLWAVAGHGAQAAVRTDQGTSTLTITVSAQFAFAASTDEVNPGDLVHVVVLQTGDVEHTFTLSSVPDFSFNPATNTTTDLNSFFHDHLPFVNITIPAGAGGTFYANFTAPSSVAKYEYVCLIPGHFQAGMYGFLGVGEPGGGGGGTSPGPGAPVFIITGVIVALVVVAIVLGFVIGRRRGGVHEMPPERLGYPEPPPAAPRPPGA